MRTAWSRVLIPTLSLSILGISWGCAVYAYGGVVPASWHWSVIGIAVAGLLCWLFPGEKREGRPQNLDAALLCLVLLLGVGQIVPLPMAWIHWLSPQRFAQLAPVSGMLGSISWAPLSSVPAASREEVLRLAAYALLYLLASDMLRRMRNRPWMLVIPVVLIALLEAALGIAQSGNAAESARGTYVNRNHFTGLLEMSLPFALMCGWYLVASGRDRFGAPAGRTIVACLFFGAAAAMVAAAIDSQSRTGFTAILASLFVMGVAAVSGRYSAASAPWGRWLPIAAVGATIGAAFIFLPTNPLIQRFASMTSTEEPSSDVRIRIWKETLPLIAAYPATGCGLGAYESCFMPYKSVDPGLTVDYAHNDYLQAAVEFGLPALAVLLVLIGLAFGNALRRTAPYDPGRYLAIACIGSLSAIVLHSFADFNMYIPANGMLAVWVAGLAREV